MPKIQNPKLDIKHIKEKALAECTVTCQIVFFPDELQFMKNNPLMKFSLKCQLWGDNNESIGKKDVLLSTFDRVFYFPDSTPTKTEDVRFFVVLGDDVLDEDNDGGPDEIYGKLILAHKLFQTVNRKTNITKIYA